MDKMKSININKYFSLLLWLVGSNLYSRKGIRQYLDGLGSFSTKIGNTEYD